MTATALSAVSSSPPAGLTVRLLPFAVADGPRQMAMDEVMLESAVGGVASARLYAWDPATVSLGYFQRHQERLAEPELAGRPWVRRATGGGAIVHDNDLTYAVALPRVAVGPVPPAAWHDRIHETLVRLLNACRLAVELASGRRKPPSELSYLCFAVPQPGDVLLGGKKVIGGAQRLRSGTLLQHGSIQLALPAEERDRLTQDLIAALGWAGQPGDWTAEELCRIEELAARKYSRDWWNCKR